MGSVPVTAQEPPDRTTILAVDIAVRLDEHADAVAETALRYAVETWLRPNNVISVSRNAELPLRYRKKHS